MKWLSVPLFLTVALLVPEIYLKFTTVDLTKYRAGESEYELIHKHSQLPDYGKCWKATIVSLNQDCKHLTAELQGKLALAYLNCFLQMQGLQSYFCESSQTMSECSKNIKDSDRNSLATFFTHTQNICYFLESQVWHDQTEQTINRLASSSQDVATQLEEASGLQYEMLQQQKVSLNNQEKLSDLISSSTNNIHNLFNEFKNTTNEQRHLITDLFEKVTNLQSMVLGEFTGFFSIVYYTIMVVMSYLLTSTPRTSAARFWLFGIATINILSERFALSWITSTWYGRHILEAESSESVYRYQWMCRKISGSMALLVLGLSAYFYQDINIINNQLLNDIKRLNMEIRTVLLGNTDNIKVSQKNTIQENSFDTQTAAADTTGYKSDSTINDSGQSDCESTGTDGTYVPSSLSTVDSYLTCHSWDTRQSTLTEELNEIQGASPLEFIEQIKTWTKTGTYGSSTPIHRMESRLADSTPNNIVTRSRSVTPKPSSMQQISPQKYFLRSRTPVKDTNSVRSKSPESLTKTVKAMAKINKKYSSLTRYTVRRRRTTSLSSDEG